MKFLISGGTGFIGSALCARLIQLGHQLVVKTRKSRALEPNIQFINNFNQLSVDENFDVAINLAGEPIANKGWSDKQKQKILESRLQATQEFLNYFAVTKHKPALFISGSAIGFYGIEETNSAIDESFVGDSSFSSTLCSQWEAVAIQAQSLGIRTCLLRTGIVLGKDAGALKKMLLPFKLGLGGKIGSGKQWMPWIHLNDMIGIIEHCIENKELSGAINCTAPNPVTNSSFSQTLGKVLQRPTVLNMPAFVINLLMGEMGRELLLSGKKVVPLKLATTEFKFEYEQLESALTEIVQKQPHC